MLPSWERRDTLGAFKALFLTLKEVFFQPVRTFTHMPITGGIGGPLLFAVIVYTIRVGGLFLAEVIDSLLTGRASPYPTGVMIYVCLAMVSPVLACVVVLSTASVFHAVAALAGAARNSFEGTLRVICYAWVPASIPVFPFFFVGTSMSYWNVGVALKLAAFMLIGTISFRKALRANHLQTCLLQLPALLWLSAATLQLGAHSSLLNTFGLDKRLLAIFYWLVS